MPERHHRRNDDKRMEKKTRGATLIEVVVAVLLSAVMVSAIFSVALTAKSESKMTEESNTASQAVRQLSAQLHLYVTGYYNYISGFNPTMNEIPGPSCPDCALGSGNQNTWAWNSVTMPTWGVGVSDSCGGYVLAQCTHSLQHYLPQWFESAPYDARISYTVTVPNVSEGPQVNITTTWNNP